MDIPVLDKTFISASDLSTKDNYAGVINSSGQVALAGAGADAIGIILDGGSASGEGIPVRVSGVADGILGGTVASGARVMVDSSGKFVTADPTGAAVGICLVGGSSGELRPILIGTRNH